MEMVAMVHPDLPETKENPRLESKDGFQKAWSKAGWKLAPKSDQPEKKEK